MGLYLMKHKRIMMMSDKTQPALANAAGIVRAPVPTIRLNMNTSPVYESGKCHVNHILLLKPTIILTTDP